MISQEFFSITVTKKFHILYLNDSKILFSSFSKTELPKKKTFTICIKFGVVKYKKRQKYVRDQWQH